jgi:hypothetical protein
VLLAAALTVVALIGFGVGRITSPKPPTEVMFARLHKLDLHCDTVAISLDMDVRDLMSDDPTKRLTAADRFAAVEAYHSEQEIGLCTDTPPDLTSRLKCWLGHDFTCLERLARAAASSVKARTKQ